MPDHRGQGRPWSTNAWSRWQLVVHSVPQRLNLRDGEGWMELDFAFQHFCLPFPPVFSKIKEKSRCSDCEFDIFPGKLAYMGNFRWFLEGIPHVPRPFSGTAPIKNGCRSTMARACPATAVVSPKKASRIRNLVLVRRSFKVFDMNTCHEAHFKSS